MASMHEVSFLKIGKVQIGEHNAFKGHEQTLDLKVWRTTNDANYWRFSVVTAVVVHDT